MESQLTHSPSLAPATSTLRRKRQWAVGTLAALVVIGVALSQASPSVRAAIVEPGQRALRDAEDILAARSPGDRLAGAFLTKVKKALGSDAAGVPGDDSSKKPPLVTRNRLIPPRNSETGLAQDLIPLDIPGLLAPLDNLGETVPAPQSAPFSLPASFPIVLLGDAGGLGGSSGGGQSGGGGTPISEVPPAIPTGTPATPEPSAPLPEPSTWLSMMVGLSLTAAALRRRRRIAPLPV